MINISIATPSVSEWTPSVTFTSTTTSGSGIVTSSFQWQVAGTDISNATASTLTVAPVLAANAGDYSLKFTGSNQAAVEVGHSSSAAVHLYVNPVVISISTAPTTVMEGEPAAIVLVASSSIPMTFGWNKGAPATIVSSDSGSIVSWPYGTFITSYFGGAVATITTTSGSSQASSGLTVIPLGAAAGFDKPLVWAGNQWVNQW